MKTEEASGTCKEKRKNNQTRCTKNSKGFKNSALGDTSTLLGSEQRLMALSNKGEREKKFCCLTLTQTFSRRWKQQEYEKFKAATQD